MSTEKEAHRIWRNNNKRKCRAYRRKWRITHRMKLRNQVNNWRRANPDKTKAIKLRWDREHPHKHIEHRHRRRALLKEKSEDCSEKIKLLLLERFCRWRCIPLNSLNRQIDHIIPLSRGGLHIPDNLAAACSWCNLSKKNKLVEEWSWRTV